jgi:hypothetical protein
LIRREKEGKAAGGNGFVRAPPGRFGKTSARHAAPVSGRPDIALISSSTIVMTTTTITVDAAVSWHATEVAAMAGVRHSTWWTRSLQQRASRRLALEGMDHGDETLNILS